MKNFILVVVLAICLSSVKAQTFVCPSEGTHSIPHPSFCSKYLLCVNGTSWEMRCGEGLHWSEEFYHCANPDLANCKINLVCPDVEDVNFPVIIADENDCERYDVCCAGEKVSLQCGPDFHFNSETLHCDTKENAKCELDPDIDITITCPTSGIHFLPHPRDCHYYFICANGEESSIQSCAEDLYWDAVNSRCDVRDNVFCAEDLECPDTGIVFVPHPKSCRTYFMCIQGTPNQLQCAPGFHWNEIKDFCDVEENVVCKFQCPSEGLHFFPHEFSCQHYFMCTAGKAQLRSCADNLLWDAANSRCDLADNVVCEM